MFRAAGLVAAVILLGGCGSESKSDPRAIAVKAASDKSHVPASHVACIEASDHGDYDCFANRIRYSVSVSGNKANVTGVEDLNPRSATSSHHAKTTRGSKPRSQARRTAPTEQSLPAGYNRVGADRAAFEKAWPPQPGGPSLGTYSYTVVDSTGGHVISYVLSVNTRPKMGALDLTSSTLLPPDADPLNDGPSCRLWKSRILGRALRLPFVIALADVPNQAADVELRPTRPTCP